MLELLKTMLKEEWRIHSTFFGTAMFGLFPLFIACLSFGMSFFIPVFRGMISGQSMILFAHYLFVFFGINVGAFGLFGSEFMNRRFGQASLLAYSSRTLPVTERSIFLNVVIKDIIYYLFLWIVPLIVGFGIASMTFLHIPLTITGLFLVTLPLSFLIGLSVIFFISMLYARSVPIFIAIVTGLATWMGYHAVTSEAFFMQFSPIHYFFTLQISSLWTSLGWVIIPSCLALVLAKFDFPLFDTQKYVNRFKGLSKTFGNGKFAPFMAKDVLDLKRSHGGFGKIFFSFFVPVVFIWIFVTYFVAYIPLLQFGAMFALLLGLFSSSIYTWLTEFDQFNQYLFLPVSVSTVLMSKLRNYLILNVLPILTLIVASFVKDHFAYILPAFLLYAVSSFYALSITMLLTGLSPNILLTNVKILFFYLLAILPVVLTLMILSVFTGIVLVVASLIIFGISFIILRFSFRKWNSTDHRTY